MKPNKRLLRIVKRIAKKTQKDDPFEVVNALCICLVAEANYLSNDSLAKMPDIVVKLSDAIGKVIRARKVFENAP